MAEPRWSGLSRGKSAPLLGRAEDVRLLTSLLDDAPSRGQALMLHGEPGIGKSRLLSECERSARERGMGVLKTTGTRSEAHLPFAGLHQLLRPERGRVTGLRDVARAALDAAFGVTDDAVPEHFRIAMAVLDLIGDVATDAPLLLIVEDVHWLDRPTADVLAFAARRIEYDPIVLLAAIRDGYPSTFSEAGVVEHKVVGLDDQAAAALLGSVAPDLPTWARVQVLREAAGNPLAILELPTVVQRAGVQWAASGMPLTKRLERAFAERVSDLPDLTRLVLLVAALSDQDQLDEILAASSAIAGSAVDLDTARPGIEAGVVSADQQTMRFLHPLMSSAIAQSATVAERRRIHEALAEVLSDRPDRRAWHRAALLTGEHEEVALELEEAGARARRRGAVAVAVTAMKRAAELGAPATRDRRLLTAAGMAVEIGRRDLVAPLLQAVDRSGLGEFDAARMSFIEETALTRPLDPRRWGSLLAAAVHAEAAGDHDLHVNLLWLVAQRAWWVDPGPDMRRELIAAADRLGNAHARDPRVLAVHAYADPWGHAAGVLERLTREARAERLDADAARFFGPAALVVGAFDLGNDFLAAAVEGLRAEGRLTRLPLLLMLHACTGARLGDWTLALTAADEARRLAEELGDPQAAAAADTAVALVAGMRGDEQTAELMSRRAELVAEPAGANITMAYAQFGRVSAALAAGRHGEAYASAERLFDPQDSAYHPVISSWLIADLADAARHVDRRDAARARVEQVATNAGERPGAWIALGLRHARALVADPAEAGQRFEEALAGDLTRWPFQRARIQLGYGQWLRRHRRVSESRTVLRAARHTFDALGCAPWGEQARHELRASGERSRHILPETRDQLTAQELQIAELAARGLSNREIGQRLFLSHRTISTHLYRIYPKLGITGRAQLGSALSSASDAARDI